MAVVPSWVIVPSLLDSGTVDSDGRAACLEDILLWLDELSAMEFSLSRDGIAGVWGVCGECGLLGDDEADTDAGATIPGTLVSCRLDELDDRCICMDDVIDSVKALFDSLIMWNLDSWATVLFVADSPRLVCSKLLRVFLLSSAFKNSEMLSSSA